MEQEKTNEMDGKAEEKLTYEQAMQQLEALTKQMEQGELPIDELGARLQQAQHLIAFCKQQLLAADKEIKKILEDETRNGN